MSITPIVEGAEVAGNFCLYVNTILARGGKVYLTKDSLVFQPTNLIDKSLGAKDVTIELSGINKANIQGILSKNLIIIEHDRIYRFIGDNLEEFLNALQKAMEKVQVKEI